MSFAPVAGISRGRVLVTDGEFKHTLGIVRTLAEHGYEVHLIARSERAPAVHSNAVRAWHQAPAPDAPEYDEQLLQIATSLAPVSLVPVGNGAVAATDRLRDRWPAEVRYALAPRESLCIAADKERTAELARSLGIATPRESRVRDLDEARAAWSEIGPPLVLKSPREEGRKVIRYVRDEAELEPAFHALLPVAKGGLLAQQYIPGRGWGFSVLYWEGKLIRGFAHQRVREWPPSGGTSACAQTVLEPMPLERAGTLLMNALHWHGVAMVEFKGNPEQGSLVLMEINAKFWGSLDLALAAGVCFPADLVALMEGHVLPPQSDYPHVRFSWPLGGDLWHGLFRPQSLPRVLWDAVSPWVAHNFRWTDPVPHRYEISQWVRSTPGAWREFKELR